MDNIKDYTLAGLEEWLAAHGEKPFRARQIFHWLYQHREMDFAKMSTLAKSLRALLAEHFHTGALHTAASRTASDGTRKYTFRLHDGHFIETVLMPNKGHYTLCLSTQAGCAMGCTFCKTATMGLARNLTVGEIVQQMLEAYVDVEEGNFIRNIVFMGMGEPLHNYANLTAALRIFSDDLAFGLSDRRLTVSTAGLIPGIQRFIQDGIRANLAISLHAVDDVTRSALMPVNKRWPIAELLAALKAMPNESRIRITFEYLLIRGVNDDPSQARQLVKLLHGLKCKINLIPYNAVAGSPYKTPEPERVRAFQQELMNRGLIATLRISKGQDIQAACGQLAAESRLAS